MNLYLLVNGNFVPANGMDMPNLAVARVLAEQGNEVHLVTHRVEAALAARPNVKIHYVPKLIGSYLMAAPVLDLIGRRWARVISKSDGSVLVNGGNCRWGGVNWIHYVHAAYHAPRAGGSFRFLKNECAHWTFSAYERAALHRAQLIIVNSERTRRDLIEFLNVADERIHTVYYGIDAGRFRPRSAEERAEAKVALGWPKDRPTIAFIGALGDRRKGFDKLFIAWRELCRNPNWDADLAVIGTGAEQLEWEKRAVSGGLLERIRFLGFREDVPDVLTACDALIAPTRYEAYGQGVHEALCCGLPALVSRSAGVAERYSTDLQDLLIPDPENADDLTERLWAWREHKEEYQRRVYLLSQRLRAHTWEKMAEQVIQLIDTTI